MNNQRKEILSVLKKMQACTDANETYKLIDGKSFNLLTYFGICYNVKMNVTFFGAGFYLEKAFESMQLHLTYPVEMQLVNDSYCADRLYNKSANKFNRDTDYGKLRLKLLDDLIQYFEKEVATNS